MSQDAEIDSLKNLLQSSGEDTTRVNALLVLSRSYFSTDPSEAIRYSEQARELAEKLNFQKGVANAYKNIGLAFNSQGKNLDALDNWEKALKVFENMGDKKGIANMYSNFGVVYYNQADDAKALEYYLKSLKIADEIKDIKRQATVMLNIGAIYGKKATTYDKAIDYYKKDLPLAITLEDNDILGTLTVNLGEIYLNRGDDSIALDYFQQSLKAYEGSENVPTSLNFIGKVYMKRKDYNKALNYQNNAFQIAKKLDAKLDMTQSLIGLAKTYYQKGDVRQSLNNFKQAETIAHEIEAAEELKNIYEGISLCFSQLNDFSNAFRYQSLLIGIKDTLYNIETDKKLGTLSFSYDIEKKQGEINLLTKDQEIKQQEIKRQRLVKNGFIAGFAVVLLFAGVFFTQRNRISKEKHRSDELLLNILPEETAEELKATGKAKAKSFDMVSVLFTDFKNFTQASELLSAEELVEEINHCYCEFDKIVTSHGIEKIKTIGDAYMCAGGLPVANTTNPMDVVKAGLEMQQFMESHKKERQEKGQPFFELRLGIHTGPVVAGIVGIKKFAYDIWGDTVNTASRMESSGEIGKVNISGATFELVKDHFECIHRGKVMAKNKGEIDMYFVSHRLSIPPAELL